MKIFGTIGIIFIMILGDVLWYIWASKEYDPGKRHNCEGAELANEEFNGSLVFTIGINLTIIGFLFSWWGLESITIILLLISFFCISAH